MARPSLSQVIARAATDFPDNSAGAITPAVLRSFISYMLSAIYPAFGYLSRIAAWTQTIGTTPVSLIYDTATLTPIVDYSLNAGAGTIVRLDPGTTAFEFTVDVAGSNGISLTFQLYKNGAPTLWKQTITMTGAANPNAFTLSGIEYSAATATYEMRVFAESAGQNVEFSNAAFIASSQVVYEYI
jgi:hypothetical protein